MRLCVSGASGHGHQLEVDGDNELVRRRHLRAHRERVLAALALHEEGHALQPRDTDRCATAAARRAREARRQRGHEGRHEVHRVEDSVDSHGQIWAVR